jgi:hypothetical protein
MWSLAGPRVKDGGSSMTPTMMLERTGAIDAEQHPALATQQSDRGRAQLQPAAAWWPWPSALCTCISLALLIGIFCQKLPSFSASSLMSSFFLLVALDRLQKLSSLASPLVRVTDSSARLCLLLFGPIVVPLVRRGGLLDRGLVL